MSGLTGSVPLDQPGPQLHGAPSDRRIDEVLSHVVHELYAVGLDLHSVLGLFHGHRRLAEDRVQTAITRLDIAISTIHQAGARLASARTEPTIDALIALFSKVYLSGYLHTMARQCVELLGCDATVIVLTGQEVAAAGPNAASARELCQLAEGPCQDTCQTGQPVTVADLAATSHWPLFTTRARAAGFRAVHTLPLSSADASLGALAMFSTGAHEPSAGDVHLAEGVAGLVTAAVTCDEVLRTRDPLAERLRTALADHVVIEQAKGVLSERHGISIAAAHKVMITHSYLRDVHLMVTAQAIVDGTADLSDTVRRLR